MRGDKVPKLAATSVYSNFWTAAVMMNGGRHKGGRDCKQRGIELLRRENLLTTVRSHEGHGTKLTNVVSRINETSYMS